MRGSLPESGDEEIKDVAPAAECGGGGDGGLTVGGQSEYSVPRRGTRNLEAACIREKPWVLARGPERETPAPHWSLGNACESWGSNTSVPVHEGRDLVGEGSVFAVAGGCWEGSDDLSFGQAGTEQQRVWGASGKGV